MDIFLGKYTIGYTLDMGIYQQYWGYIGHIIVLYWTIVDIYIYIVYGNILMIYYSYWDILLDIVY